MSVSMMKANYKRKPNLIASVISTELIDKKSNIPSFHQNPKQVEQILKKQIKKANQLIKYVNRQYSPLTIFNSQYSNNAQKQLRQFRSMEHQIRRRNIQIRLLEQQIKNIQNGWADSSKKLIQVYLSEELTTKSMILQKSMLKFKEKQQSFIKFKQNISQMEQLYISKCLAEAVQATSYEQFKQKYLKQKSQNESQCQTQRNNKKLLSQRNTNRHCTLSTNQLKQRDFNTRIDQKKNNTGRKIEENTIINIEPSNKNLKELRNKRNVAQTALKAAKRKHIIEMNSYESKLQFLSDQYQQLENKLNQKIRELAAAQKKFKQTRKRQNNASRRTLVRRTRTQTS